MDTLRRLYAIVVENIRKTRSRRPQQTKTKPHSFKVNDMVLVKDPDSAVFKPKYQPNYRVTAIFGDNRIEVQDEKGHKSIQRWSHVKYVEPSKKVVKQLPGKEILQKYGRSSRVLLTAKDIPDIQFKVNGDSEFPEHSWNLLDLVGELVEVMEMNVCPQNVSELFRVNLQNSKNRERSGNLLNNVVKEMFRRGEVGVALQESTEETTLQGHRNQQLNVGGTLRQSNNLSCSPAQSNNLSCSPAHTEMCGESHELSLNSLGVEGESCLQTNQSSSHDEESEQGPGRTSECGKPLPVLRLRVTAKENDTSVSQMQKSQQCTANTRAMGGGNFSESSQEQNLLV